MPPGILRENRLMAVESSTPEPISTLCLDCGYVLDHLAEPRCPECGRPFDPRDPSTFTTPAEYFKWRRWAQPPPMTNVIAVGVLGTFSLVCASGGTLFADIVICLYLPVLVGLLIEFVVRVRAALRARQCATSFLPASRRGPWRWAILPSVTLLLVSSCIDPWPLRARFALSRPAFERVVRELDAGAHPNRRKQSIGLYSITSIRGSVGGPWYFALPADLQRRSFVYNPQRQFAAVYRELAPSWFIYEWDD
jgi:hypothetical protein